jgi:hypothetical protein
MQALPDAKTIAQRFNAKLVTGHVVTPDDYTFGLNSIEEAAKLASREAELRNERSPELCSLLRPFRWQIAHESQWMRQTWHTGVGLARIDRLGNRRNVSPILNACQFDVVRQGLLGPVVVATAA